MDRLTEAAIARLVDRFYAKVRRDPALAPIFEAAIGDDWTRHLGVMRAFWSSVMLTSGRYKGNPVAVHRRLTMVREAHFQQWLALFEETADELFAPTLAESFKDKARRIAASLKLAMFYRPQAVRQPAALSVGAEGRELR